MNAVKPIVVHGPNEGSLALKIAKGKVTGDFTVSLADSASPGSIVLYRLRVKESSILFSKTYGMLGSRQDSGKESISICADREVAQAGRLSTIRVEYLTVTPSEAETVMAGGGDKNACRPFFEGRKVRHYDVSCEIVEGRQWLKFVVVGGAVAVGIAGAAALLKYKGSTSADLKRAE